MLASIIRPPQARKLPKPWQLTEKKWLRKTEKTETALPPSHSPKVNGEQSHEGPAMMTAEPKPVSPAPVPESRPELRGHPYRDLQNDASKLATRLELRALRCESTTERKRLRVLAAAQVQVAQCLSNTGVKSNG
jgi:hypothetical protein